MKKMIDKLIGKITNSPNWNKVDEICPCCGKVTKQQKGITKQNLKRLIKPKLDLNELIFTILLILVLLLAFSYMKETKVCQDWVAPMINNSGRDCLSVCNQRCLNIIQSNPVLNFPVINETIIK